MLEGGGNVKGRHNKIGMRTDGRQASLAGRPVVEEVGANDASTDKQPVECNPLVSAKIIDGPEDGLRHNRSGCEYP